MYKFSKRPSLSLKAKPKLKVFAACFSAFLVAAFAISCYAYKNSVYEIFINKTSVGYVQKYETYETALNALIETDGEGVSDEVTAKRVVVFDKIAEESASTDAEASVEETSASPENQVYQLAAVNVLGSGVNSTASASESSNNNGTYKQKQYISSEKIESLARQMLELKQAAVALSVNDTQLAILQSKEDAAKVIEGIKAYYTPADASTQVLSVQIREDVQITDTYEYKNNIVDCDSAVQKIVNGTVTENQYELQDGDTIWDISSSHDISIDEIKALNPDVDLDNVKIGDTINLSSVEPYVNVEVVADITSEETIPYETEEVDDSSILKGNSKVTQEGVDGSKEVVIKTTKVNGIITNEEIVSSTVTSEPVNKIVAVGTKVITRSYYYSSRGGYSSSVSTSGFIRPCWGSLSSDYGYRSGGFHSGIDLAAPTGTSVVASKAGTVVYSGWNGGYGYCVIIDHGNGVETLYAHNSKLLVSSGESVSQGEVISLVGSTGNSTGPHCHFEVRVNGSSQNPWNFIN